MSRTSIILPNADSGGGGFTQQTLTEAASIAWDVSAGNWGIVTIADDRTIANPTGATAGQEMILDIIQGTLGNFTLLFDTNFHFPGGVIPELSAIEGVKDSLRFKVLSATEFELINVINDIQ
jgi:hypothetical protein